MKSIAAKMVAVTIALGASSAACAAVNLHGEAGAEFTNLSASFGAGEPGMTFSSQWAHSDNDGDSVGLGMGYNFNLGPFLMTLGGKAVYLNPKDGDEGYAIAAGGGAELPLVSISRFSARAITHRTQCPAALRIMEANAGVRLNVLPSLNIEAGYRYIDMAGKDGNRDNTLADGAYAGVNFRF